MLREIETALVDRLKLVLPGYAVEPFPDKPASYRLLSPKGAVLVVYRGSGLSPTQDVGMIVQERVLQYDITLLTRDLRSHTGAYALLDVLYQSLLGFAPPNCGKIWIERDGFVSQEDGVWQYEITLAMRGMAIEDVNSDTGVLLSRSGANILGF